MFGRHDRLEEALRQRGRSATAQIVEAVPTRLATSFGPDEVVTNTERIWKLRLRVSPEGEEPFEVELRQAWPQLDTPRAGQTLPVLYDPSDRSRVSIDRSVPAQEQATAAMVEGRIGSEGAAAVRQATGLSIQDMMSQALADPQGFAARMREQAAAAQQEAMAQVARMSAEAEAARAAAEAAAAAAGSPPSAPFAARRPGATRSTGSRSSRTSATGAC